MRVLLLSSILLTFLLIYSVHADSALTPQGLFSTPLVLRTNASNYLPTNASYYDIVKGMSPACVAELNLFFGVGPEALIKEYCDVVNLRVLFILGFVLLMWLFEPALKKKLSTVKYGNMVCFMYKWIGVGLLFLAMLVIYTLGT